MYFKIPELGMVSKRITAKDELRPVIIITSNSEKSLPDAFMRRCIYYDIPFPDDERLGEIVLSHMQTPGAMKPAWLEDAIDLFSKLRQPAKGLDKKPSTAELLNWITYLRMANIGEGARLRPQRDLIYSSLSALFKSKSDQERADPIVKEWLAEPSR